MRFGLWCVTAIAFVLSLAAVQVFAAPDPCCIWVLDYYENRPQASHGGGDDDGTVAAGTTANQSTDFEDVESPPEVDSRSGSHQVTAQYWWHVELVCPAKYTYEWKISTSGNITGDNSADAAPAGWAKATANHALSYQHDLSVQKSDSMSCTANGWSGGAPNVPVPDSSTDTMNTAITKANGFHPGTSAWVETSSDVSATWTAKYVVNTVATNTGRADSPIKFEGRCLDGSVIAGIAIVDVNDPSAQNPGRSRQFGPRGPW